VNPRGFTLLEVVLASALFALLMSVYYLAFSNVLVLDEFARSQRAFGSIGPAVLDLVEDDLLSLYTAPQQPAAFPFRGEDDSLASEPADRMNFVVRRASIHREEFFGSGNWLRSPVNEVGFRLARGTGPYQDLRRLYRRESYYVDGTPLQGGDHFEVYDRVVGLDVVYAGYRVEESERTDQSRVGTHGLDRFESWDSEERKAFPTAAIVFLTIEPPQVGEIDRYRDERPERRTFVRIVPLPQADDVPPPPPQTPTQPGAEAGAPLPGSR
jgi:prepilin-type N-terminal cleavage/methylation domain-containing protein